MKLPCSGLLPRIEVGLCYLRKWRRGESLLFILKQASRCRRVYTAPGALVIESGNSIGKVAFHHSIFCQGVLSFISFANEATNFESVLLYTTYLFHYIHFILTLGICTDTQISSPHISCILANKALPFFVTLPTPFLITFLLTRLAID